MMTDFSNFGLRLGTTTLSDLFKGYGALWQSQEFDGDRLLTPRPGYVDAGIVLTEPILVTLVMFTSIDDYDWERFGEWVESMSNLVCEERVEKKLLYIWSEVPCITTLQE